MKVGTKVMLVGTDGFMPPLAAVGMIVGPLDQIGDHEVLFPDYPCPVAEETWEVPAKWLMPLDDSFADAIEASSRVEVAAQPSIKE